MRVLLAAAALAAFLLLLALPTASGPLEARRLYERARALRGLPWRTQVPAWRAALAQAHPSDRTHRRALEGLAGVLRRAGLPHGAAAYETRAAALGPARDRRRLASCLLLARGLRAEGDLAAAAPLLARVADLARSISPKTADRARDLQVDDALDAADLDALEHLVPTLAREHANFALRLRAAGALGLLRLDAGDEPGARRALADAERLYRAAQHEDDDLARRCAKLWLDLELRGRLTD